MQWDLQQEEDIEDNNNYDRCDTKDQPPLQTQVDLPESLKLSLTLPPPQTKTITHLTGQMVPAKEI